jgi:hypothetical protein
VLLAGAAGAASRGGRSYYVDPAAAGAGTGTSWRDAWTSFGAIAWSRIGPGDTLYVSGGRTAQRYNAPSVTISSSGTSASPVKVRVGQTPGHSGVVIFDYASLGAAADAVGISLGGSRYISISGDVRGSTHWQIANLYNTAGTLSSAGIAGDGGNFGIGIDHMSFVNDNNPIRITSARGITIAHNTFRRIRGDAAVAMAGSQGSFGSSRIFGNVIERICTPQPNGACPGPDGIQVGSGVSIYNNDFRVITTTERTSSQHPDAIQAQGDNLKIYGNTFTNVGDSDIDFDTFADPTPHDVWVYNNVFRIVQTIDPYPEYFRLYRSSGVQLKSISNFKILNNTFVDETGSYRAVRFDTFGGSPTATGNQIENNIFYNVGDGSPSGPALFIDPSSAFGASSWTIDHNVYYRASGAPYVVFEGKSYTAAAWVASHERHGRIGRPLFLRYQAYAPSNDFRLSKRDSVARGAGAPFPSLFKTDKAGVRRPARGAWDAGAFEAR